VTRDEYYDWFTYKIRPKKPQPILNRSAPRIVVPCVIPIWDVTGKGSIVTGCLGD
jgi:hypothetical protein